MTGRELLALAGGLSLFLASSLLLFESRYNLTFINHHIDVIASLQEHAAGQSKAPGQPTEEPGKTDLP